MQEIVDALCAYTKTLIGQGNEFPPESLKDSNKRQSLNGALSSKCAELTLKAVGRQRFLRGDGQNFRRAVWQSFLPRLDRLIESALATPSHNPSGTGPINEVRFKELETASTAAFACLDASQTAILTIQDTPLKEAIVEALSNVAKASIEATKVVPCVADIFASVRHRPFNAWAGPESSAHLAAVTMCEIVLREWYEAIDIVYVAKLDVGMADDLPPPKITPKKIEKAKQRFQALAMPDIQAYVAEMQWEFAKAVPRPELKIDTSELASGTREAVDEIHRILSDAVKRTEQQNKKNDDKPQFGEIPEDKLRKLTTIQTQDYVPPSDEERRKWWARYTCPQKGELCPRCNEPMLGDEFTGERCPKCGLRSFPNPYTQEIGRFIKWAKISVVEGKFVDDWKDIYRHCRDGGMPPEDEPNFWLTGIMECWIKIEGHHNLNVGSLFHHLYEKHGLVPEEAKRMTLKELYDLLKKYLLKRSGAKKPVKKQAKEKTVIATRVRNPPKQPQIGLNATDKAVLEIIRSQAKGQGVIAKKIVAALKRKGITVKENTLRRHCLPKLKRHCRVVNHPASGGYCFR